MSVTSENTRTVASTVSMGGLWPGMAAALLGLVIVFGVGFAHSDTIHNAAHDSRHSTAFPCH